MRLIERLRSHGAAGLVEYALLVGLIAVACIGAVTLAGERVIELFGAVGQQIAVDSGDGGDPDGEPGEEPSDPPTSSTRFYVATVDDGESSVFEWTVEGADSFTASAQLSGTCSAAAGAGSAPRELDLSGFAGNVSFSWRADLAGCQETVCVTATAGDLSASSCASLAYIAPDTEVTPFAFEPVDPQRVGAAVSSSTAMLEGFEGTLDLVLTATGIPAGQGGVGVVGEGTPHYFDASGTITLSVEAGTQIALFMTASSVVGEIRAIEAAIGTPEFSTSWEVTSRAANKEIFLADGSFSVPDGVRSIEVKAWGGSGGSSYAGTIPGGGGGAVVTTIPVIPSEVLTVRVGKGGTDGSDSGASGNVAGGAGWHTGGPALAATYSGGGGGGASALLNSDGPILVAGGGGGAGRSTRGGAGGGQSGESGVGQSWQGASVTGGSGGTQSGVAPGGTASGGSCVRGGWPGNSGSGGAGNSTAQCGAGSYGAGGGGGGWQSGGGGAANRVTGGGLGSGGGGGSSFIYPTYATTGAHHSGSGGTPGNAGDPDFVEHIVNGPEAAAAHGLNGLVVIVW